MLAFAARLTKVRIKAIGKLGFREKGDEAYYKWLGRRHREEIWGYVFTNAMAIAVRLVVGIVEGEG